MAFLEGGQGSTRQKTSCPKNGKLFLKAEEPQVGERHKDEQKKMGILPHDYFPWMDLRMVTLPEQNK